MKRLHSHSMRLAGLGLVSCLPSVAAAPGCVAETPGQRPNIVVIMADDLGYSDLGCYGGEIQTPHIDALATQGVRFTQFYNAARCCPSRASLLTGKYAHQVGLALNGRSLSRNSATIAEVLKANGYHTGMSGKWHLSETKALPTPKEQLLWLSHRRDTARFAPLESYPCNRGFEEHWGIIWGVASYFDPFSLVHNEEAIREVPDDFYMTDFITEKSVGMIDEFSRDDHPFFLYVAYTAPHWPLHALPEDLGKYRGKYDEGWDVLRENRYRRGVELGIIDSSVTKLGSNESHHPWSECTDKQWEARHMEAHAAMVDRLDQGVGKMVAKLKELGELDNTVIIFLADNGASPERGYKPGFDRVGHKRNGDPVHYIYTPADTIAPGPEESYGYLGINWAGALNAPFRYWKKESFAGGCCTPMIVVWPDGLKGKENTINQGVGHVIDFLPTCLELAGARYPDRINGFETQPVEGKSLIPLLKNQTTAIHDTLFWEHEGGRALRAGDWKIAALKGEAWELFNLAEDRSEVSNLAARYPEKVQEMESAWERWNKRVNVNSGERIPRRLCRGVSEQRNKEVLDGIGFLAGSAARSFK
jgi:arylsulfatase